AIARQTPLHLRAAQYHLLAVSLRRHPAAGGLPESRLPHVRGKARRSVSRYRRRAAAGSESVRRHGTHAGKWRALESVGGFSAPDSHPAPEDRERQAAAIRPAPETPGPAFLRHLRSASV